MRAFALSNRYLENRAAVDNLAGLAVLAKRHCPTPLDETELRSAQAAWAYFTTFTDQWTGFAPASDRQSTLSPWEMGATLLAIVSAGRLGIITPFLASKALARCLECLARMPLCPNGLPARHYQNSTLKLPSETRGWSAREILRLVSGFVVVARHYPTFAPEISLILNRWRFQELIAKGRFWSGEYCDKGPHTFGDCYLGYEQYAARTGCLINLRVDAACDPKPILRMHKHLGISLPGDKRCHGPMTPHTTCEPFLLEAMEFGWRKEMLEIALTLYLAQKSRFEATGILTGITEDVLDTAPWFANHAILAGGRAFTSLSRNGQDVSHLRCLSTKACFAWASLLPTPYSQKLLDAVSDLATPIGWYTGIYEATGRINRARSLNTNAAVLEALHYKAFGPLFPLEREV